MSFNPQRQGCIVNSEDEEDKTEAIILYFTEPKLEFPDASVFAWHVSEANAWDKNIHLFSAAPLGKFCILEDAVSSQPWALILLVQEVPKYEV